MHDVTRWCLGATRRHLALLAVATLLTGAAWTAVVPPFEGTDELFFYNRARELSAAPERRQNLFYRLTDPIIRTISPAAALASPEYNPAFRFVSNQRGRVNRFAHDRPVAPREHVRTLLAIRVLVVLLAVPTVLLIYGIAALTTGNAGQALVAAGIALWIPQFSFINAVAHIEAVTRLFAAAATLLVVARATGRLPRLAAWFLLTLAIVAVPFADRQALFIAPFAALGLIAGERGARARAIAACVLLVPSAIAAWIVVRHTELGTDLRPWFDIVQHPLSPFTDADPARGSIPPTAAYYAFEFVPKMFVGFWGWLGQPSILLPAWMYGSLIVLVIVAFAGMGLRLVRPRPRDDEERKRQSARRLMAAGIALMCVPIVYAPAIMGLNLWYGRWLFPMIGPLAVFLVLGVAEFSAVAARWPHRVAAACAGVCLFLLAFAATPAGAALRRAFVANHYGDRDRLLESAFDAVVLFGVVAVAVEAIRLRPVGAAGRHVGARTVFTALAVANAILLTAFVRPLYAPLSAEEYAGLITENLAMNDRDGAADIYASAVKSYPESRALRQVGEEHPTLLLGGKSPGSRALFWDRLARGKGLDDRDALLMLAREMSTGETEAALRHAPTLQAALAAAERRPDLSEAAALVRMALAGDAVAPEAAEKALEAGAGHRLELVLRNGECVIEGFTAHRAASGDVEVIVYFRPHVSADNRGIWLRFNPVNTPDLLEATPRLPPSTWTPGALAWEAFELPPGTFTIGVGMREGSDLGPVHRLGVVP